MKPKRLTKDKDVIVLQIEHPLFDNVVTYTEDELKEIATKGSRDELAFALMSMLRFQVGRYVGAFRLAEHYIDDLVSEGYLALLKFAEHEVTPDMNILLVATDRVKHAIESVLNVDANLFCPSYMQQRLLSAAGEDCLNETRRVDEIEIKEQEQKVDYGDNGIVEVLDAVSKIDARDHIDEVILSPESWDLSDVAVAKKLGVSDQTVRNRREELYQTYLKLTR